MDAVIDLDAAAVEIESRINQWRGGGLTVGAITWRDQGEGWPPPFKTHRAQVKDADSIGIALRKDNQEGEVVLFKGGWCDFIYWTGDATDDPVQDTPGYPDGMTVAVFGATLDRLTEHFR